MSVISYNLELHYYVQTHEHYSYNRVELDCFRGQRFHPHTPEFSAVSTNPERSLGSRMTALIWQRTSSNSCHKSPPLNITKVGWRKTQNGHNSPWDAEEREHLNKNLTPNPSNSRWDFARKHQMSPSRWHWRHSQTSPLWSTDVSIKLEFLSNFESGPNKLKELLSNRIYYTVSSKQYGSTVSLKMLQFLAIFDSGLFNPLENWRIYCWLVWGIWMSGSYIPVDQSVGWGPLALWRHRLTLNLIPKNLTLSLSIAT